jgi:hypothetical protein
MKVDDLVYLVTEQFTDGRGIDAITKRDDRCVVRTHWDTTVAKVVAVHDNGNYDLALDDGQIWTLDDLGQMIGRYFESSCGSAPSR